MRPEELLARLKVVLDDTEPNQRLAAFKAFKAASPDEFHGLLASGFDLYSIGLEVVKPEKHTVVALIHGIRTQAIWQEQARVTLEKPGKVAVYSIGYEYFDVVRFIGPWRSKPISRVRAELRDLRQLHPSSELVVVAHSFGTYIISRILREDVDISISRLLLCGSIIPPTYRWDQIRNALTQHTCVNEVGTRDFWPVFAKVSSLGYGCSGSFGFKTSRVRDRFFDFGHSDFFSRDHFEKFWRPFVWDGQIVSSPWDEQRPVPPIWISILGGLPFIKIILGLAIIGLGYLGYSLI
jgi:pimeloyl-ACP methyl ester carboxylesterase